MGHTLEENGKWGSWRGWPGKDGIPPYTLRRTLSHLRFSPPAPLLDALLLPHTPSSTCRLCCSSSSAVPLLPPISYFVLSPSSRERRASRLTPPSRLKAPGCPPPLAIPRSAVDTPMRATPRQGRCAGHNGRRYRDSRGEERGPTDPRVAMSERIEGSFSANGSERSKESVDAEKEKEV